MMFTCKSSDEGQLSLQTFTIAADKATLSLDCWEIILLFPFLINQGGHVTELGQSIRQYKKLNLKKKTWKWNVSSVIADAF